MVKRGCSATRRRAKQPQQVQNDDEVNANDGIPAAAGDHFETKDKSFRITAKKVVYPESEESTVSPLETEPARISFARTRWGEFSIF